jgi:hypothetical protein
MFAEVGDRLVVGGDPGRAALIVAVPHGDGTPPYVVRWVSTGHIAMVSPAEFSRIVRAEQPDRSASPLAQRPISERITRGS